MHVGENVFVTYTARASSRSTPSPAIPKQLTPLTPASTRKNKNKQSQPSTAEFHAKQLSVKTNQPRDSWVRSPSPAAGSQGRRSRAAGHRSTSPAFRSPGQRSEVKGQRSDVEGESAVFSRQSSSLTNKQCRTMAMADLQQMSVVCYDLLYICYIYVPVSVLKLLSFCTNLSSL